MEREIWTAEQIAEKLSELETRAHAGELTTGQVALAAFNWGEDHGLKQGGYRTVPDGLRGGARRGLLEGLPAELLELYRVDPMFHAVVVQSAIQGLSQLRMLTEAVQQLAEGKKRAIEAHSFHLAHCVGPVRVGSD